MERWSNERGNQDYSTRLRACNKVARFELTNLWSCPASAATIIGYLNAEKLLLADRQGAARRNRLYVHWPFRIEIAAGICQGFYEHEAVRARNLKFVASTTHVEPH